MPLNSSDQSSWSMFVAAAAQFPRRRMRQRLDRIIVLSHDADFRRWVEHEIFGERMSTELHGAAEIVTSLTLATSWPRFLVIDGDTITSAAAKAIREAGWPGIAIAVGDPSQDLIESLEVEAILPRTLHCELLRNTLKRLARRPLSRRDVLKDG